MKRFTICILVVCTGLAALWAAPQKAGAEAQLQAAINKETIDGDLKGAIEQYKKLAQGNNRAVAAQALIHMGECYEKLGSKEARAQYDLVINKFADQKDAVAQARAHLGVVAAKTNGMATRQVWDKLGSAVSPDGRYVAFEDDTHNLALHDVSTGADRRLTTTASQRGDFPEAEAFSPDGKQIAYGWHAGQDRDLRVLNLSGTGPAAPRVLLKIPDTLWYSDTAWSPDGKSLAVHVATTGFKIDNVILVSLPEGTYRVLYQAADHLYFSPDSKYLACDRFTNGKNTPRGVYVLAIDGGREIPAVVHSSNNFAAGWSPDGKHLLFVSNRAGPRDLWSLPFQDQKPQGPPTLIKGDFGSDSMGQSSRDALYYHVHSGGASSYLEIAPFDAAAGRILSPPVTVGPSTVWLDWSPDGKNVAYMKPTQVGVNRWVVMLHSMMTGQSHELRSDCLPSPLALRWAPDGRTLAITNFTRDLCQADAQTEQVSAFNHPVGPEEYPGGEPAWSPDQKKLYFRAGSDPTLGGDNSVAFIERDLASGSERVIIRRRNATDLGDLKLSPDGRFIATLSRDESAKSTALSLIPVAGGEPKELLRRPDLGGVFISPDSKYIALVGKGEPGKPTLVIPVAGGEPRELMTAAAPLTISMGMWAPDSRSIFLKKSTTGPIPEQTEIWRVPVEGGQPVKLDMNVNPDHIIGPFRVSPDGRQIAFVRGETILLKNEIWVLENFLSALTPGK